MPARQPNWDFLYELSRFHLELQLAGVDAVDAKLMGAFTIATAEVAFIPAVFVITGINSLVVGFLFGVMLVAYLAGGWAAIRGLWSQRWAIGLESLDEVEQAYLAGHPDKDIRKGVQGTLRRGYAENLPKTQRKQNMLRLALVALAIQSVGAALSLAVVALTHSRG